MTWYAQRIVCYATMARLDYQRRWEALHKDLPWHNGRFKGWRKDRSKRAPFHRDDGVTITATDVDYSLGGDFLGTDKT